MHHAHPRRRRVRPGWSDLSLRAKGFVVVSIPVWAMIFGGLIAYWANQAQDRATDRVQRSTLVRSELDRLLNQVTSAGGGTRAYLLALKDDFLTPYHTLSQGMPGALTRLSRLVEEDARQSERVRRLKVLAEENLALLSSLVEGAKIAAPTPTNQGALLGRAKLAAETLRREVAEMDAQEGQLQVQRQAELTRIERWRSLAEGGEVVVGLLGTLVAVQLFSAGIVRRVRHLGANADRLAEGLPLVALPQAGGDEIGALARQLEVAGALLTERGRAVEESLAREQQARQEAERANLAKSEFLSNMSHELRTPLNAILGFGQLLEMGELDSKQQEGVVHILGAGRHLLGLIDEILDIARIESGHLDVALDAVNPGELALEAVALIAPQADKRSIQVICRDAEGEEARAVWADRQRLKQVLINLLSNAVKYNHEGGKIEFSRTLVPAAPDGGEPCLRLTVRDTGPGIAPEDLARLFTPFERLDAARRRIEGTGIGLCLTRKLAEAMDGRIVAESTVGQGSAFSIELPLAPAAPPVPAPATRVDHGAAVEVSASLAAAALLPAGGRTGRPGSVIEVY